MLKQGIAETLYCWNGKNKVRLDIFPLEMLKKDSATVLFYCK